MSPMPPPLATPLANLAIRETFTGNLRKMLPIREFVWSTSEQCYVILLIYYKAFKS